MTKLKLVKPRTLAEPVGPFSRAVKIGSLVLISGTTASSHLSGDLARRPLPSDFESQARITLENLDRAARAAGARRTDIAKLTVFLRNPEHYATFNRVRAEFFGTHRPASTAVVTGLIREDMLVEVEAVAFVGRSRRASRAASRRPQRSARRSASGNSRR